METPPPPHTHTQRQMWAPLGRREWPARRLGCHTVFRADGAIPLCWAMAARCLTSDPVRCWPMGGQDSPGDRRERAARAAPPTGRERA